MAEIPAERHDRHEWHDRDVDAALPAPALLRRVSWGAIFAGAVTAVALMALFSILGLAIGLDTIEIGEAVEGVPTKTALWWAVSSILATGIGAFMAGRLAGIPNPLTGAFHGAAVWAVSSLVVLWLAASAVGFAFGLAGQAVSTTARVAGDVVTTTGGAVLRGGEAAISAVPAEVSVDRDRIRQEAASIASQAGIGQENVGQAQNELAATARDIIRSPGDLPEDLSQLIDGLFRGPDAALSPQEQDRLATVIANRLGVSRQEAEQIAQRWQGQARVAWTKVRRTGETTATEIGNVAENVGQTALDVTADVSWYMFWSSLAGLVAALVGAALAAPTLVGAIPAGRDADVA